jgi:hypothetical protein
MEFRLFRILSGMVISPQTTTHDHHFGALAQNLQGKNAVQNAPSRGNVGLCEDVNLMALGPPPNAKRGKRKPPCSRVCANDIMACVCRQLFDISIAYETDPNDKNFKSIHSHVQNMSGKWQQAFHAPSSDSLSPLHERMKNTTKTRIFFLHQQTQASSDVLLCCSALLAH